MEENKSDKPSDDYGFSDLCENYTNAHGGPSRLTQVLNVYIGAMVQEILIHKGDVLKFSGDAFLSMWKKTARLTMQDVVHTAIDCGLIIQKNYGTRSNFVIVGQPVWDVKMAEYMSTAGDVLTSASAWMYVNEAEYCTQPCGDGRHTKVLGVGATWKRVEKLQSMSMTGYKAVVAAMRSSWWPGLRRFMLAPLLRAVDNDEPLDFLTEVRRVVVVFLNIMTEAVTDDVLIGI
ncbi:Uncharacterized protein OBRU01_14854, partial [Operophtera brumata]